MPYTTRDPNSGAVLFHPTATEKSLLEVQKENNELKDRLDKLEALLTNQTDDSSKSTKKK